MIQKHDSSKPDFKCSSCIGALNTVSTEVASPFERQVILDFYDGALTGVLECGTCGTAYFYTIIDWDEEFEKRIFSLAPLRQSTFDKIIRLSSRGVQTPRWPVWVPNRLADEPERSEVDKSVERLLKDSGSPCLLVAADRYIRRILASRVPEAELYGDIQKSNANGTPDPTLDWFEYLSIAR